jgi:TonB family protein
MAKNRNMHLQCGAVSVLIHGILLVIFFSSNIDTPQKTEVIEIVPMDECSLTLPIDETVKTPVKPKPPEMKEIINPADRNSFVKDNEDLRFNPIPSAVENSSEPPIHDESQKDDAASTQGKSISVSINEPADISLGGGIGIEIPAGSSSGSGSGNEGNTNGNAGSGSGTAAHSTGDGIDSAGFGSPSGPRFLHRKIPEYPFAARKQKKEGKVVLAITIDMNGRLMNVEVLEASDPLFVPPSITALQKSSFLPATRNGTPITVKAILPIRFALTN